MRAKTKVEEDLLFRISSYLQLGGLFNPEMMEHDKVRDLIIDLRGYIEKRILDENE